VEGEPGVSDHHAVKKGYREGKTSIVALSGITRVRIFLQLRTSNVESLEKGL